MRRAIVLFGTALACLLACKAVVVNSIQLVFENQDGGQYVPGFGCDALDAGCTRPIGCLGQNEPLADKVLPSFGGSDHVSLVVDFLSVQGNPRCDPTSLSDWCATHHCAPIDGTRVCIDVPIGGQDPAAAISTAIRDLPGTVITTHAPTEPVVVRLIATAQGCDAGLVGTGQPTCADVVGCAISCPVELGSFSGPLELAPFVDVDVLGNGVLIDAVCAPSVALCAQTPLAGPTPCVVQ